MVNAYDFFASKLRMESCVRKGIHDFLGFDGPIMLDSGGYQWLRGKKLAYDATSLARFANQCEADHVMALDYPPRNVREHGRKFALKNLRSFQEMDRITDRVIPVVHAPLRLLRIEMKLLSRMSFRSLAFGGLLPSQKGGLASTRPALEEVSSSKVRVHLLGFASPSLSKGLSKTIRSVDFAGWRNAAAYGYILLPSGYRKVSARNHYGHARRPSKDERGTIRLICKRLNLNPVVLNHRFAARAIFSAYVVSKMLFRPS